jgi:hypothetical protein
VSTVAECRDTPSPRALDLLQKLEPDIKEGAPSKRFHRLFPGMVRPSSHAGQNNPTMVDDWLLSQKSRRWVEFSGGSSFPISGEHPQKVRLDSNGLTNRYFERPDN